LFDLPAGLVVHQVKEAEVDSFQAITESVPDDNAPFDRVMQPGEVERAGLTEGIKIEAFRFQWHRLFCCLEVGERVLFVGTFPEDMKHLLPHG
jgi:hypothetical protein